MRSPARTALALTVALQLVAETALTPYWPRLLRDLFGVTDLAATGGYLTACRVAGLAALPLWGLAARRWPLPRLLVAGLLLCAAFDLAIALAPTLWLFTLASAGVVAAGSSLVLAYPALVDVVEGRGRDRLGAVVLFVALFHAASVLATSIGAGVVAMPEPRLGLGAFAVVDLALAWLVWRAVPVRGSARPAAGGSVAPDRTTRSPRRARLLAPLGLVAALAVLADLATAVPRPFFVELAADRGAGLGTAGVLFWLPSAAALAVLPLARPAARVLGHRLLPAAALLAAAGLLLQAAAPALAWLALGRVTTGLGLGLLMVAVDLRVLAAVGTGGPGFAGVETARSVALLAAPVLATVAATGSLAWPLVAGALLFLTAAAVALVRAPRLPDPNDQEVRRDPVTV